MRVLTDPIEIRAFRKRQIRKVLRMLFAMLNEFMVRSWFKLRRTLIQISIASACVAIWCVSVVVMVWCLTFILENCTL